MIACYIEGFKDGRTLMLAADHAAQLRKPIVMVKVGKTAAGRSMAQSHTGHLTGSDAVTSAVFRQFGVTRVDGLDELLEVSMSFARTRPGEDRRPGQRRRSNRACACTRSRAAPARTWPTCSPTRACGSPISRRIRSGSCTTASSPRTSACRIRSTAVVRRSPTRAAARSSTSILADKNVDILVIPITGAVVDVQRAVHARHHRGGPVHDEARLRRVGRARRNRRHVLQASPRRRAAGLPHVPQLRGRGEELRRLLDVLGALPLPVRRRADGSRCPRGAQGAQAARGTEVGRGAVGMELEEADPRRTASRRRRTSCAHRPPRPSAPRRPSASPS